MHVTHELLPRKGVMTMLCCNDVFWLPGRGMFGDCSIVISKLKEGTCNVPCFTICCFIPSIKKLIKKIINPKLLNSRAGEVN